MGQGRGGQMIADEYVAAGLRRCRRRARREASANVGAPPLYCPTAKTRAGAARGRPGARSRSRHSAPPSAALRATRVPANHRGRRTSRALAFSRALRRWAFADAERAPLCPRSKSPYWHPANSLGFPSPLFSRALAMPSKKGASLSVAPSTLRRKARNAAAGMARGLRGNARRAIR